MSIKVKMILLGLVITACISAMAVTATICMMNLSGAFSYLRSHEIVTELSVVKVGREMNYLSRLTRDIMLGGDFERDIKAVHDIFEKVSKHFDILEKAADSNKSKKLITEARSDARDWLDTTQGMVATLGKMPAGSRYKFYKEYERDLTPKAMKARDSFAKILEHTDKDYNAGVRDFQGTITKASISILVISFIAIVIIILSFIVILRTILVEIKNRHNAEEALSASEKTARALLDGIDNSAYLIDPDGMILAVNANAARRAGKNAGELVGTCLWSFYDSHPEISHNRRQKAAQAIATREVVKFEDERNGRIFDQTHYPVLNDAGEAVRIAVLAIDITEQKKALKALEESEKRFRTLIEDSPIGISMCRNLRYYYVNQAYTKIFGFNEPAELIGTLIGDRIAPQFRDEITALALRCIKGEKVPCTYETIGIRKDGSIFPFYVDLTRLIFDDGPISISFARDLTERRQARELMVQAEKMAMVGGLAAGMAHEINNPIGIIIQNLQNIELRLSADSSNNLEVAEELGISLPLVRAYLEKRSILKLLGKMYSAGERAAKIVSNLLIFSRKSDAEHSMVSLPDVIERAVELAANDYDLKKKYDFRHIKIIRDFAADLPQVSVNPTEFEQVIINVLKNAAQAMAENRSMEPEINIAVFHEDSMVVVKVSDNGPGMDEATRRRIFEPFFTTKEVGSGTGLGLSVSYTIITQHHKGLFTVDSILGEGACFTIKVPLDQPFVS